jgi:muramidase (phage lysozyme)
MWAKHHRPPAPEWAIPAEIVRCESNFTNEPPNSAGAAGFYQILGSTWTAYGGSAPADASQHSRAEQDTVARRIVRDSPRGLGEWDCARMLGYA